MMTYSFRACAILLALCAVFSFNSCEMDDLAKPESELESRAITPYTMYALTSANTIHEYYYNGTFQWQGTLTVSGLQASEFLLSIDFRPATGQLYGVTNQSRLYFINLNTGAATSLTLTPFTPAIVGTKVGLDFNPTVDRIRLVTDAEQNLRLHPETGATVSPDGNINYSGSVDLAGAAYTNSVAGATTTTLYDIDILTDALYIQNPPNAGTLVLVGSLGINAVDVGGFDISPDNKNTVASITTLNAMTNINETHYYGINLTTGAATQLGIAEENVIGVAIRTDKVGYAINAAGTSLLIMNLSKTVTPINKVLTGQQSGETILGIDMRPATGQLFALGSTSRLYTINTANGALTLVGSGPFTPTLDGTHFGFDFNPTVDRIRIVSNTGQNLRAHPTTGAVLFTDTPLNPGTPTVTAVAYTNNFAGATTTTLYDIDTQLDKLFIQTPPNMGALVEVGPTTINFAANNGFDIGGTSGDALGLFYANSVTLLYSINLATGKATPVRRFTEQVNGFALGIGF